MPDDERTDRPETPESAGFSRHVAVFIEDSTLWPLLFIFIVHVALAGALMLLAAVRGSLPALAALVLVLALCVDRIRRARQRRRVAGWIATLWLLSGLTAAASGYLGLL